MEMRQSTGKRERGSIFARCDNYATRGVVFCHNPIGLFSLENSSSMPEEQRPNLPALLAETTAIQAVGTMAVLVVPTIAPKIAETIGVPAARVGFQISILYLAAMFGSLT